MDDSCAVCAEILEWVAYGACGHKVVCSTCVARLRFICDDRRCCICKTESDVVFVTKALGDYTKTINDFSLLPSQSKEGRVNNYWYHEDTQAYFDDLDHYKMIMAMCRLSCGACDKLEDGANDGNKRRSDFKKIEQLRAHLFHKHRLMMCSLCLEGRKVFICEQKLYTRSQLTQHTNSGDSEVDGTENERGGFMGHPRCEFCRTPFYGDNELYTHMSTEHYKCHICQRQHPGQYEYYKNYDDLEIHFRRDHFLCEDEDCLAKKFTVFQSDVELKRHNTLEHGGHMSRSKRSASLQIPTSFRYQRNSEQDRNHGRQRTFQRDFSDNQLSLAIQASLETSNADPSSTHTAFDHVESSNVDTLVPHLEYLLTTESETISRYRNALFQNSISATLGEVSFPPLPGNLGSSQQNSHQDGPAKKTMAAHLRNQSRRKVNTSGSAPSWPADNRSLAQPEVNSSHAWPSLYGGGSSSTSGPIRHGADTGQIPSAYSTSAHAQPASIADSSFAGSLMSSRTSGSTIRINHSFSAPNLSDRSSLESSFGDFPPVSAAQTPSPSIDSSVKVKDVDVQMANKSLVEKIRLALGSDEDKYTAFKQISSEYRQGSIDAGTYLAYVVEYNLSHLIPELARLLPDVQKQKELISAYNVNLVCNTPTENVVNNMHVKDCNGSRKGKGKSVDSGNSIAQLSLADKVMSSVKELQSTYRDPEVVDVLSKDGYRFDRGKAKVVAGGSQLEWTGLGEHIKMKEESSGVENNLKNSGKGDGKNKQKKKTSKFHRVRLGDGSIVAPLDLKSPDHDPDLGKDSNSSSEPITERLPASGVWRNGGGQKLFAKNLKESKK